jgi:phage shock protein E
MLGFFKNLVGTNSDYNIRELLAKGAIILDVRTEREFNSGHVKGSINIPLDKLHTNISKLKKDKPIITCCASGMRSVTAKNILKNKGFTEVYNAGSWIRVNGRIQ